MFLSPRADTFAGDRSPWGDFWFNPVPWRGTVGTIDVDAAMRLTAVYACVRIIAEGVAMLPFTLYRPKPNRGREFVKDHWLYRLLAVRPNDYQNPFEFREMMQGHVTLRGNAYARIVEQGGEVTDLLPLSPDAVKVEVLDSGNWRYRVKQRDGSELVLPRQQVFHLRGLSNDGIMGLNPIAAARETIGVGLAAQSYGRRFFENDGRPGGWIEYPGNFKDAEQRTNFKESWSREQSGTNRGKTGVLEFGMKFHEVTVTNDDAQFLETRKFQTSEIARLFRVPPHLIGDLEKATFSNIEQQSIDYVMHTLTPWLVRWEEAIEYTFLADDVELEVEFPTRELLRGDTKARAEYAASGILNGYLTRNEMRIDDGRDPIDGLDEPLVPLNMVEEGADPPGSESGQPGAPKKSPSNALRGRRLALLSQTR